MEGRTTPDDPGGSPEPGRLKKAVDDVAEGVVSTQVWRSVMRHDCADTPRNRLLFTLSNFFLHLHPAKIPRHSARPKFTWCMGGISVFLFVVLTFTGTVLMFYYHPDKANAYRDIKELSASVPFGAVLRNLHRWAAHAMVITVMLHMFRVFLTGSYKPPREFNWVIGVLLLVLTMLLSFTGYLLTDDQLGFWAVTVGTNMARATPLLGHEGPLGPELGMLADNDIRFAMLGGTVVGGNALLRAYIWHCVALPLIIVVLMMIHFWRVRKDGGISGPARSL